MNSPLEVIEDYENAKEELFNYAGKEQEFRNAGRRGMNFFKVQQYASIERIQRHCCIGLISYNVTCFASLFSFYFTW